MTDKFEAITYTDDKLAWACEKLNKEVANYIKDGYSLSGEFYASENNGFWTVVQAVKKVRFEESE